MIKQLLFAGQTEQGVFAQALFGSSGCFEKTAGAPPFADWETGDELRKTIGKITKQDREKYCHILVNALGASEYYGSNINADWFPWLSLAHRGRDYGHETFRDAHVFLHHKNKPHLGHTVYGDVPLSILNTSMRRVELIARLDREICAARGGGHIIDRVDAGEFPDVSMGCFPAGTLITMGDGTRKSIEEIRVGDEVLTHRGHAHRVTKLHRRHYSGPLHFIRAEAHQTLRATKQHPFYSVPENQVKEKDYHATLRWVVERELRPDWVDAEALNLDSYLLEPVPMEEVIPMWLHAKNEQAFARLLGYYLAEGHLLRNKKGELSGIELTTHKDDPVHGEIERLCSDFGTKNPPSFHNRVNSENSVGIYIFDRELAEMCSRHAGSYSKTKKLSKEVMLWPKGLQFQMLGAYANGDGCGPFEGSLKFSTSSQDLSWQVCQLLLRKGFIPSHSVLHHDATGFSSKPTIEYVVHIGKQQAHHFASVCAKVRPSEVLKAKNSRVFALEKGSKNMFIVTPIREMSAFHVEMEVFNFEVEEDNSFVAEGLAVHNCKVPWDECSICLHRSAEKEDYCQCMRPPEELRHIYGPNRILPDGRVCCVKNIYPRFFDISFVFIGADKIAKVMAKLAYDQSRGLYLPPELTDDAGHRFYLDLGQTKTASALPPCPHRSCTECDRGCGGMAKMASAFGKISASNKVAEIIKDVPASAFAMRKLPELEHSEPDISPTHLDELAKLPLPRVLGASTVLGMILKPHEFQHLALRSMGEDNLLSQLSRRREIFPSSRGFMAVDITLGGSDDDMEGVEKAMEMLKAYVQKRGAFGQPFSIRVHLHRDTSKVPLPTQTTIRHPLLDKLGAAYNGYRRAVLTKLSQATEVLQRDPRLREAVLGEGLGTMMSKTASSSPLLTLDSVVYMMGAYLEDRRLLQTTAVETVDNNWLS